MNFKILIALTPAFNPNAGGVQRATYKLGKYLAEQGHQISYFSLAVDGHIESKYGALFKGRESGGAENSENLDELEDICASVRPDFVINQMPYDYNLTEKLGTLKNSHSFTLLGCLHNSLFSVVNNLEESMKSVLPAALFPLFNNGIGKKIALERHKYLHRRSLRHILSNHDRYILLTPPNNKELKYFVGDFMQEKIVSIPNSIAGQNPVLDSKSKTILHVGRLNDKQKRSDLLIPFWIACKDRLPGWEFVVVGDGPYKNTMEEEISTRNVERIKLAGFQKPDEYYKTASLFMMPSAYEGFPFTILEAQSYGCPVLAYNSYDAISWIVNDGEDAFLSEPYNVDEMADSAVRLATNDKSRLKAQKAALQNADRFTVDKVGEQWKELFESLAV